MLAAAEARADRREDTRDALVASYVEELTENGSSFYPFSAMNLIEALNELPMLNMQAIATLLAQGDYIAASVAIRNASEAYWRARAEAEAERIAAKKVASCHACFGRGCNRCEEP